MGIMQTFKRIFSTNTETSEKHYDEKLQTHYYKSTKDKVLKEVEAMFNQRSGFTVSSVSEEHGEIIVRIDKGKKALIVGTVIMVKPFRTAVDFSVSTDTFLFTDFGYSSKVVQSLYKDLNKRLTFVGTGLGEKLSDF
ncbi:DUF1499 domain-containing protein [Bacillus shivajii]|uniref:DUF1499 domain-containing protein n=1 Tax=Bacillus shivajii TaxID=1983719 RepID=UPI001CFB97FB|nr:DUF1499 domain-containing protein [Bacillus shivajii]UCZ52245.1 DUF1499 domain-containing protein [Bacillus shivajii]